MVMALEEAVEKENAKAKAVAVAVTKAVTVTTTSPGGRALTFSSVMPALIV